MLLRWTILCALLLCASAADASPFEATLSLDVLGAQLRFVASGNAFNTPAHVTLPGSGFTGTEDHPVDKFSPSAQVVVSLAPEGPGSFNGAPLAGPMPLRGLVRFETTKTTVIQVPLNSGYDFKAFGVGGTLTYTFSKPPMSVNAKARFQPWSAGMATVPKSNAMYTGSDARTPGGRGQITLVSPAKISFGGESVVLLGTLRVNFVPEPAAPLLLATGAALLCVLGRRRCAKARA